MTGGVMLDGSSGDEPFLPLNPPLLFRIFGSMMWKDSLVLLKNRSLITAAPSSSTTSKPL